MKAISYRNLHFPSSIIQRAVWVYARFNLSLRDVEELMAERGVDLSYETIRRWVKRFGPPIARGLRRGRPQAHPLWHLDEMYVSIGGRWLYLWRAIDRNGEVLDILVQARRDKRAALKLMRKLLKKHGFVPRTLVTDKWRAYGAAFPRTRPHRLASPSEVEEQPHRRIARSRSSARTSDARLPISRLSPTLPLNPRRHL